MRPHQSSEYNTQAATFRFQRRAFSSETHDLTTIKVVQKQPSAGSSVTAVLIFLQRFVPTKREVSASVKFGAI
jgi:hypothetical protein